MLEWKPTACRSESPLHHKTPLTDLLCSSSSPTGFREWHHERWVTDEVVWKRERRWKILHINASKYDWMFFCLPSLSQLAPFAPACLTWLWCLHRPSSPYPVRMQVRLLLRNKMNEIFSISTSLFFINIGDDSNEKLFTGYANNTAKHRVDLI